MPAIEFVGYTEKEAVERMERYGPMFRDLDYADDFIFIIGGDTRVIGLNGVDQPLVRVRSRYPERNATVCEILAEHEDVETFLVEFQARRKPESAGTA